MSKKDIRGACVEIKIDLPDTKDLKYKKKLRTATLGLRDTAWYDISICKDYGKMSRPWGWVPAKEAEGRFRISFLGTKTLELCFKD